MAYYESGWSEGDIKFSMTKSFDKSRSFFLLIKIRHEAFGLSEIKIRTFESLSWKFSLGHYEYLIFQ